jgi:hypothetical protein
MPNELFWLGGLCPFRGPAASENAHRQISEGHELRQGVRLGAQASPPAQHIHHVRVVNAAGGDACTANVVQQERKMRQCHRLERDKSDCVRC